MSIALTKPSTGIIQGIPWAIALSLNGDYTGATWAGAVQHGKRTTDRTVLSFGTPVYSEGRSLVPISIAVTGGIPLGKNWTWDVIAQLPDGDPSRVAWGTIAVFGLASDPGGLGVGSGSPKPKLVIEIDNGTPLINLLSDADPEYIGATVSAYLDEIGAGTADFETTFTDASLNVSGILPLTHNLNSYPSAIALWDGSGTSVDPDEVSVVSVDAIAINLSSFVPLSGTWRVSLTA